MQPNLFLVVGSGRSGTSLFSALCQRLGFYVPLPEVKANASNPTGFGEPRWVVNFQRAMLRNANVLPLDARPQAWDLARAQAWQAPLRDKLRTWLAEQFDISDRIIIKDPRSLWFLDTWRAAADELDAVTSYVTLLRHPAEVVVSRHRWYGTGVPPTGVVAGWINTMLGTEAMTRDTRRAFVSFEDLVTDWRSVLKDLGPQLGRDFFGTATCEQLQAAEELVDPALVRSRAPDWTTVQVADGIVQLADDVWGRLQQLVVPPVDEGPIRGALDAMATRYGLVYDQAEAISRATGLAAVRAKWRHQQRLKSHVARATPSQRTAAASAPRLRLGRRIPRNLRHRVPQRWRNALVGKPW